MKFPLAIAELRKLTPDVDTTKVETRLGCILRSHKTRVSKVRLTDGERHAAYEKLHSAVAEVHKQLSKLIKHDGGLGPLAWALRDGFETDFESVAADAERIAEMLKRFERWTALAVPQAKPTKGRPDDQSRRNLILELADIFEDVIGRKAGRSCNYTTKEIGGPFVRFVEAFFADAKIEAPWGLAESIAKILKDRNAYPGLVREQERLRLSALMDRIALEDAP